LIVKAAHRRAIEFDFSSVLHLKRLPYLLYMYIWTYISKKLCKIYWVCVAYSCIRLDPPLALGVYQVEPSSDLSSFVTKLNKPSNKLFG
jgi:hypothetical protein